MADLNREGFAEEVAVGLCTAIFAENAGTGYEAAGDALAEIEAALFSENIGARCEAVGDGAEGAGDGSGDGAEGAEQRGRQSNHKGHKDGQRKQVFEMHCWLGWIKQVEGDWRKVRLRGQIES